MKRKKYMTLLSLLAKIKCKGVILCLHQERDSLLTVVPISNCRGRDKNMGLLVKFRPLLHHNSSAHNSHSAPQLISLQNCIKLWGKDSFSAIFGVNIRTSFMHHNHQS